MTVEIHNCTIIQNEGAESGIRFDQGVDHVTITNCRVEFNLRWWERWLIRLGFHPDLSRFGVMIRADRSD